jgi:hypothetical protein
VSLEDDEQRPINEGRFYLMDASSRVRLPDDMTITLKDKGKASATGSSWVSPSITAPASSGSSSALAVSSFRFRVRLGICIPSAFFGQRGITPAFGYGAPHSSARGT